MGPKLLYGQPLADIILDDVKLWVARINPAPRLCVIPGKEGTDDPYYRGILEDADKCGIKLNGRCRSMIDADGIISLDPEHGVPDNLNLDGGGTTPCTAVAIMELLRFYGVSVVGKNVCIFGRSPRVGRPLANLMVDADATVTLCHSKSEDVFNACRSADILVGATGDRRMANWYAYAQGCRVFIDVGSDFQDLLDKDLLDDRSSVVPFVGGVGPVTRAVLMRHLVEKAMWRIKNPNAVRWASEK